MDKYDKADAINKIVKCHTSPSCGRNVYSIRYGDYNEKEHGDITIIITETDDEIQLWQLFDRLEDLKKALYKSGLIDTIYCNFLNFNQVAIRCYYKKEE